MDGNINVIVTDGFTGNVALKTAEGTANFISTELKKAITHGLFAKISSLININKPQGGFYLMPEFLIKKFSTAEEMCNNILEKTGVALLPGSDFGFSKDRMIVRLSFTDFNGREFMNHVKKNNTSDINFISKFAPKIVEGTKKLKYWAESL